MMPLFDSKQIRGLDSFAINELQIPGVVLMENAAANIFRVLKEVLNISPDNGIISLVCGKGNNAGDGFALARHLSNEGFSVKVLHISDENDLKGDALINFIALKAIEKRTSNIKLRKYNSISDLNFIKDSFIILDSLLGTGTVGTLQSPFDAVIERLNLFDSIKAAIDIPSGLDPDSGWGETIFKADYTITLAALKKGLFISKGKLYSGEIIKASIGVSTDIIPDMKSSDYLIESIDAHTLLPEKKIDLNKYTAGKVLLIAGSKDYIGAAVIAAKASLNIGAGAVILAVPRSLKTVFQSVLNETVVIDYEDNNHGFLNPDSIDKIESYIDWADSIAIGPGLGRESDTIKTVLRLLDSVENKIVIDADALFALKDKRYKKLNLQNKVLTPHLGEFARMINVETRKIEKDILNYGKNFAIETNSILVLKGAPTIIFSPKGETFINSIGNPGMAKFGSGDSLTGIITGLSAQIKNPLNASICGVFIHSLAADLLLEKYTEYSISASLINEAIPSAIKSLRGLFD